MIRLSKILKLVIVIVALLTVVTAIRLILLSHVVQDVIVGGAVIAWLLFLGYLQVLSGFVPCGSADRFWIGIVFIVVTIYVLHWFGVAAPAPRLNRFRPRVSSRLHRTPPPSAAPRASTRTSYRPRKR